MQVLNYSGIVTIDDFGFTVYFGPDHIKICKKIYDFLWTNLNIKNDSYCFRLGSHNWMPIMFIFKISIFDYYSGTFPRFQRKSDLDYFVKKVNQYQTQYPFIDLNIHL